MKNQQSKKEVRKSEFDKILERITTPEWREINGACRQWSSWHRMPPNMMNMLEKKVNEQVSKSRQQLIDEVVSKMPKKMEKSDNHSFNMGGFGQRVEGYNQAINDIITLLNNIKNSNK